mmetsp:Transcript_104492/g.207546  ORF Transcript_104492/g.207546 Transcript_104492/m.207546 type:complete len:209 (+) Transcript_104492:528-1154(+)
MRLLLLCFMVQYLQSFKAHSSCSCLTLPVPSGTQRSETQVASSIQTHGNLHVTKARNLNSYSVRVNPYFDGNLPLGFITMERIVQANAPRTTEHVFPQNTFIPVSFNRGYHWRPGIKEEENAKAIIQALEAKQIKPFAGLLFLGTLMIARVDPGSLVAVFVHIPYGKTVILKETTHAVFLVNRRCNVHLDLKVVARDGKPAPGHADVI